MNDKVMMIGLTPFERPDIDLALTLQDAGAFAVIHLGRSKEKSNTSIKEMLSRTKANFGVCFADSSFIDIFLPKQVSLVVLPANLNLKDFKGRIFYQVFSVEEAHKAAMAGATGLIIKGNEGAGAVSDKSSFILFQEIKNEINLPIWVQGGMGIHSSAGMIAAGASGVVLDSQLALFPGSSIPVQLKESLKLLDGSETRLIENFRILSRPNSPKINADAKFSDIEPLLKSENFEESLIPIGQDISFANEFVKKYHNLKNFVSALNESIYGHLRQAKVCDVLSVNNPLAKELDIKYPIAQGPMTRVSDTPEFAEAVANSGGLPFLALSLQSGIKAKELLENTKKIINGKSWGVGILGFASQELRKEQLKYIEEVHPPVVLIAGGRPSQAIPLEKIGIKTFIHAPSPGLLDIFLKEGAKRFVFEGRECGGHVGPLSSLVLWERQIERLLEEEDADQLNIMFAGGIHDSLSASIISVMSAPLAAKGVKIGVLMGSSYLYTNEAVESGAIVKQFQEQIIKHSETVLLETAPGHVTRCLDTPFIRVFNQEKQKLLSENTDKNETWQFLEQLNVGRLRIAAKGIERKGESLIQISSKKQIKQGIYMIGQVAALRSDAVSINELHQEVVSGYRIIQKVELPNLQIKKETALDIAIIGMSCIYPGAKNLDEYWRNIVLGKDCVTEVPDERWNKGMYFDPNSTNGEKTPSKWGGFIPSIQFDPVEFGIPPQSVCSIDPAQLLSLLVSQKALADAGYDKRQFDRENTSVIFGVDGGGSYLSSNYGIRMLYPQVFGNIPEELDKSLPRLTEDSFPGILANVVSGRIANRLDLGGRNYVVDAACASSLAAIDIACQDLVLHKSNMVLAGGTDLHNNITDYLMFSSTKALSKKGKCLTFDSEADGISLGEGIAVVVLKRLEDAKRDGDRVYAVIQGIGASSDGKSLGLTAPRKQGQMKALERAYRQSGITLAEVGLMEAHGTGTVVGDRTELSSMTDLAIRSGAVKGQVQLGSVKTQIGHTKCASGVAGLIKASLSIYHGIKPPTLNVKQPNKYFNHETSPFTLNSESSLWLDSRRVAGVSAFGFGGTNFHAVLEKHDEWNSKDPIIKSWPAELFVFRGKDFEEAKTSLHQVQTLLKTNENIDIKNIAYSLAISNDKPVQLSIVAQDTKDFFIKIDAALTSSFTNGVYRTQKAEGKIAFMFSGQGSQRVNMARDLFIVFPSMCNLLKLNPGYVKLMFPDSVFNSELEKKQAETVKATQVAQPLLGIVDYAIASFLRDLGIEPDMVAGHSYGELPALCFAKVFAEEFLVPLSEKRAAAILNAIDGDKGSMLAVSCKEQELLEIIKDQQGLYLANHNSPNQLVISGTTDSIKQLESKLKLLNKSCRQLEVACAFHSPLLSRSGDFFFKALKSVKFKKPILPVWSNTSASVYPSKTEEIKLRLSEHLVKPVLFYEEVQKMHEQGARIFIEVGPGKVLTQLVAGILGKGNIGLNTEQKGTDGITHLLNTLGQFIATGREIKLEKLFDGRNAQFIEFASPEKYQVSSTTWNINGQIALPAFGKLPPHGVLPITKPMILSNIDSAVPSGPANDGVDQLLISYFNNLNSIIQAQRDIIMTYLGQNQGLQAPFLIQPSNLSTNFKDISVMHQLNIQPPVDKQKNFSEKKIILSPESIKATLLEAVSERTGYPQDMLGMEMDLEADLSIDSIKRIEIMGYLKSKMGILQNTDGTEDEIVETLASIKTLNGLVNWIAENDKSQHSYATPVFAEEPATVETAPEKYYSKDEIRATLIEAVSEKTGYPQDMLGMELDLEADLSIDSIKRVEIISELKSKLGILSNKAGSEDEVVETLAAIKNLNGLVNWISNSLNIINAVDQEKKQEIIKNEIKEDAILRLGFEFVPSFPEIFGMEIIQNKKFAITDIGGSFSFAIKELLNKNKAEAYIINNNDDLDSFDGFIFTDLSSSKNHPAIADLFSFAKKLDHKKVKWFYVITDFKSKFSRPGENDLDRIQGYSGFINSLNKEWDARCRTINTDCNSSTGEVARTTINELLYNDESTEVFYKSKERYTVKLVDNLLLMDRPKLSLNGNSVVLVFGGAQGITSEILVRFSKEYPCHYILVGRSPNPSKESVDEMVSIFNKNEIRKILLTKEKFSKPQELEKKVEKIYKRNQVIQTIKSLELSGSTVSYRSVDLRIRESVINLLDEIYLEFGRIDGVIHGAGFLDDKFFQNKTYESFENVYSTKVTPLKVLVEKLKNDVRFLVLFSSIASVMGNKGQVDYSSANSVLDDYAWELGKKFKGRVVAINWGPWKSKGMASEGLEKEFLRKGISSIPLDKGTEAFINELKYGKENQVVIMTTINAQ
jgi:acyl transferase domain-containing protein/NAD(P)H-dependent flavin oxidoreductase YrpB (nitropropane dioxygenase family)/NAD(P)-dependent dehydrogenase (short-subunit alcohol dehydrogenase family)/acyl carrier protein